MSNWGVPNVALGCDADEVGGETETLKALQQAEATARDEGERRGLEWNGGGDQRRRTNQPSMPEKSVFFFFFFSVRGARPKRED